MQATRVKRAVSTVLASAMILSNTAAIIAAPTVAAAPQEDTASPSADVSLPENVFIDETTGAHWEGTYGKSGYDLFYTQDFVESLPDGISDISITGSPEGRHGVYGDLYFGDDCIDISIDMEPDAAYQIAVYAKDSASKVNGIQVFPASNPDQPLFETVQVANDPENGKYFVFEIDESCVIHITSENDNIDVNGINLNNAVVNSIFFDSLNEEPEEPEDPGCIDSSTKGNWMGTYGADGFYMFAYQDNVDLDRLPYYVTNFSVETAGRSGRYTFEKGEDCLEGLPVGENNTGVRVNSALFADESIELSFDLPEGSLPRQVAIYQAGDRAERVNGIECVSKETGEALFPKTTVDQFNGGKYVVFEVSESCVIRITSENPLIGSGNNVNNAIVNAIFFDTLGESSAEQISIRPADGEDVREKADFMMEATILPASASSHPVEWSIVEGGEIAQIDQTGQVMVTGYGEFTVQAQEDGITAQKSILILDSEASAPSSTQLTTTPHFAILENSEIRFVFSLSEGTYSVYEQGSGLPYVLNAYTQVNDLASDNGFVFSVSDVTDEPFDQSSTSYELPEDKTTGKTVRFTGEKEGSRGIVLEVTLEDEKGSLVLSNGIVNNTDEEVKLMSMSPLVAKGVKNGGIFVGPDPETNHTTMTGGGDWLYPSLSDGTGGTSKNMLTISYRDEANNQMETFVLGGLTTYEFQNEATISYNPNASFENNGRGSIDASVRVFDYTGKLVKVGQTYVADKVFLNFTEKNPYYALEYYADEYARSMNVDLIPYNEYVSSCLWYVGWFIGDANNADYGVDQAKKMYETGMAKYAPPMIRLVPDTYTNPNEQLWWDDEHWKKFGHLTDTYPTLQAYGDGIRAVGGFPGMYMQPTYPSRDYILEHQDHMINNGYNEGPDYTDPGFISHLEDVYENMKEAGVIVPPGFCRLYSGKLGSAAKSQGGCGGAAAKSGCRRRRAESCTHGASGCICLPRKADRQHHFRRLDGNRRPRVHPSFDRRRQLSRGDFPAAPVERSHGDCQSCV